MAVRSINIILCRIGAILLFVQAAENLGVVVPQAFIFSGKVNAAAVYIGLMLAAPLVGGIVLWVYGAKLGRLSDESTPSLDSSIRSIDLVAVGTYVLGLYVLLLGMTTATYTELMMLGQSGRDFGDPLLSSQYMGMRAAYLVQIALGVLLILGRRSFARLFPLTRRGRDRAS